MKKLLLSALVAVSAFTSFGQKIRFTNNTNQWHMIDSTVGCCIPYATRFTTAHYGGKIKYNGYTYQELFYDFGSCMVREENNRVYVIGNTDSTERVLYDFTLQLHDTLRTVYEYNINTSWVNSIDSTQLYGISYKVWHFDCVDTNTYTNKIFYYQFNVIDGIGCTNGVYYPVSPYDYTAYSDQLVCFENDMGYNGAISRAVTSYAYGYTGSFDNDISCSMFMNAADTPVTQTTLAATRIAANTGNSVAAPNPVTEATTIALPYTIQSGTLIIINEVGRVIVNMPVHNARSLAIGNYIATPGIYQYRVTDNNNTAVFSGKLSKQ